MLTRWLYGLALPVIFLAAFPGWWVKMRRRGGFGTGLGERIACYGREGEGDVAWRGAVMIHAVSVGEAILAIKLLRAWRVREPEQKFVLGVGTATGHAVARAANMNGLRVTYAPLDFRWMVRRYLERFAPQRLVLVEGEVWPNLMLECRSRGLCVHLVNARMSPRSARRYRKFADWLRPVFSLLDGLAVQEPEDAEVWKLLGVAEQRIVHTGSLKFDPSGAQIPSKRSEFEEILDSIGHGKPVVLAASTHVGEELALVRAVLFAGIDVLPVVVPRHAERREEIRAELEQAGHRVILRSEVHRADVLGSKGEHDANQASVLVIDSTGELRDWTAHANVVVIGKSFRATGGQNPAEAILAGKPLVVGPHMENFEPLVTRLVSAGAVLRAQDDEGDLTRCIRECMNPQIAEKMVVGARQVLDGHDGATARVLEFLGVRARTKPDYFGAEARLSDGGEFLDAIRQVSGVRAGWIGRISEVGVGLDRDGAMVALRPHHERVVSGFCREVGRWWRAEQVHGNRVAVVPGAEEILGVDGLPMVPGVDGLITLEPGHLLGIYVADCGAVWLADRRTGAVGLLHSGRKGTEMEILVVALERMREEFGSRPEDIVVALGPCIRPPDYEMDFATAIREQSEKSGVRNFIDCGMNTASDLSRFYSYRKELGRTGRMMAMIIRDFPT